MTNHKWEVDDISIIDDSSFYISLICKECGSFLSKRFDQPLEASSIETVKKLKKQDRMADFLTIEGIYVDFEKLIDEMNGSSFWSKFIDKIEHDCRLEQIKKTIEE